MALLSLRDITVAFDHPPLLDRVNLHIERGERVCLVGRNGTGKTTLMKIIMGEMAPDAGEVARERGSVFSSLPQEVPEDIHGSIFDVVAEGLGERGRLLTEYHRLSAKLACGDTSIITRLEEVQHDIDAGDSWNLHREVERVISHMRLSPDARCEELSAGQRRRTLLARALVSKPDLLLLDEPTNHLDIEAIGWLERYLETYGGTLFFVTHDRMFMRKLATRIVDLDRGKLQSWACDYNTYCERAEAALAAEASQRAEFEKKLAKEEVWLRQGVKARRTRNEGRVRALLGMREYKRSLRQRMGSIHLEAQEVARSGKLVMEIEGVTFGYGAAPIVRDFSTTVMRGDKIGIIGNNGSGKTTLLKLLLGELAPQSGSVRHGTQLQIAYFDQLRSQLREDKTVQENVCDGSPFVTIGERKRHIIGYLEDFLFPPERSRSPVSVLSGGERNRLLLAKLFTIPANVLVLDEPTNDLDVETLDLLEELLVDFQGTVLLVSHDREFLNNVVTSTIALEGEGKAREYIGGYDDWLRQRPEMRETIEKAKQERPKTAQPKTPSKKLGFNEKRELEALPAHIEELESEKRQLNDSLSDPLVYSDAARVFSITARMATIEDELSGAYARWTELEERNSGA
jgi:ATP-binding cassette subfamily F protein uup